MFKKLRKSKYNRGMTLVELMVVLGIFLLVTGITIFDYNSFRSNISLQNLADDMALSIRKAQSYAIGARSVSGTFSDGFGVSFSTADTGSENGPNQKAFVIFADSNKDGFYDPSGTCGQSNSECLEILTIRTEDIITGISGEGVNKDKGALDIVFVRPNPDANFYQDRKKIEAQSVQIEITNTRSERVKKIVVSNTGQISIE